jgi:hypothetical protein
MSSLLYSDGTDYLQNKHKHMNKETLQQEFTDFKNKVEELRLQLQKTGEQFLAQNFKDLFERFPKLEKISWSQYTPYFNDGDECIFRSNHKHADIEGEGLEYGTADLKEIESELSKFMSQFDNELLKNLFGDHVQLTVSKEGITVEEYEHE